ncbi:Acyl-CoA synthetase (AMP-forming)/AMP-acid ligase II [Marinomonas polaris DSM 16579]|uniref:Acyl-CoA synthetase (AMP-forming)/AMP-acid ligase II n=1 Tax=Marinomonas polaris DSM 16579 TaxID=1122206 RepID=A0A1M5FSQ6_9GAMM|nr:AMP-binding protein [Marinomonas polaris]SHF94506.1 Acyl-CoA synthetase (AMP-forming)/AMP-acid ligase II [Marinomonas polaris DSM 16579]
MTINLVEKILSNASENPNSVAVYLRDKPKTYSQLVHDIKILSANIVYKDECNSAVLITASNTYEFIVLYFAVHFSGGYSVIIPEDSDVKYKKFVFDKVNPSLCVDNVEAFFLESLSSEIDLDETRKPFNKIADLMFTSGTTGEPKGVVLTHEKLYLATEHIVKNVKNKSDDIELLLMPLSHSFGMGRMRSTLYAGGTLVLGYPFKKLKDVFKAIEYHNVTGFGLVPSAWNYIVGMSKNLICKYASRIRYIEFGSAYLPAEEKKRIAEWFPNTNIVMHYGLTEVSRAFFIDFHKDPLDAVGNISAAVEVIILNEDYETVSSGEEGEIAIKSPWMLSHYYMNEALSKESVAQGFFKTGDLGKIKGGYLYLTGRLKEIINVGGKKVSPYQVEMYLNSLVFIKESGCIALPDSNLGEVVQAFIVIDESCNMEQDTIIIRIKKEMAKVLPSYMRPQKYSIVKSIPKTPSGKMQRLKLLNQ